MTAAVMVVMTATVMVVMPAAGNVVMAAAVIAAVLTWGHSVTAS